MSRFITSNLAGPLGGEPLYPGASGARQKNAILINDGMWKKPLFKFIGLRFAFQFLHYSPQRHREHRACSVFARSGDADRPK